MFFVLCLNYFNHLCKYCLFYNRKIESDEERRKRTHLEALEDVFDDVTYMKKARLDLPLVMFHFCAANMLSSSPFV